MSTNVLAPFVGVLVLVVGVTLVNQPKTPNANPPYILSSDSYNPYDNEYNQSEEEEFYDENFDPDKPWVEVNKKGKKTNPAGLGEKGFTFHNPTTGASAEAEYVGEGTYQPKDNIFKGGQDSTETIEIRFENGDIRTVSSTDMISRWPNKKEEKKKA